MPIRWYDGFHRDDSVGMAVLQLLTVGGIPDLTMRAVARAARLALGSLGNHYGSKEQMLMGAAGAIGHLHVDDVLGRSSSGVGELVRPGSVLGLPAAALLCGRAAEAAEALAGPAAVRS